MEVALKRPRKTSTLEPMRRKEQKASEINGMAYITDSSLVTNLVTNLVTHLSQPLKKRADFVHAVKEQVRTLYDDLQYMRIFLKDFGGKRNQQSDVMEAVYQIGKVAYEVKNFVDTYVGNVAKERRKFVHGHHKATIPHIVNERIKGLKTKIEEIYKKRAEELEFHDSLRKLRMEVAEKDDVIGFVEEAETLVSQLVMKGKEELDVISIFGMGGLGKTTLANKVFNDPEVKEHFTYCAWVSVSQSLKLKELLKGILKQVTSTTTDEIPKKREEQLKRELKEQLSHHRYLVVLDDIWKREDWDKVKAIFPDDTNGSRVFVTTRYSDVARYVRGGKDPLHLRFLNDNESWELFTKKVCGGGLRPMGLEPLGREMVSKCGGLPLAIVLFGDLLASEDKTNNSWNVVVTKCLDILRLSYEDLPHYLQHCFLYLGLFPQNDNIPARKLIQLWIAEGFIQADNKTLMEKVADHYLQVLIDRGLIQVKERRSDGGVKTCWFQHDLIRLLCIKLSTKLRFFESHNRVSPPKTEPQRLSVHCSPRVYISNAESSNTSDVRTLLCFKEDKRIFCEQHWGSLFQSFKLLRVLDLGKEKVYGIPKAIDKLVHLKYLRVKTFDVAKIPSTIYALGQLQTLDLRMSRTNLMPEGIWSMQQLRHLYLDAHTRLPKNVGRRCLSNLQTLCYIYKGPEGGLNIAESAPNLRKLGLYRYQCNSLDEQDFTFKLPHLESLKFARECLFEIPIKLPPRVTKITIKKARLNHKAMEMFQNLSVLRILKLDGASFDNDELVFQRDRFPELQLLKIKNSNIVNWKVEEGAVQKLNRVVVSDCLGLTCLPEELLKVTNLKEIELSKLHGSFTEAIGKFGRSDLKVVIMKT